MLLYPLNTFYEKGPLPLTYWRGRVCEGEMSCKLSWGLFRYSRSAEVCLEVGFRLTSHSQTCNQGKVAEQPRITFISEGSQVLVHPNFSDNEFGLLNSASLGAGCSCFSTLDFASVGSSPSVPVVNWEQFSQKNANKIWKPEIKCQK